MLGAIADLIARFEVILADCLIPRVTADFGGLPLGFGVLFIVRL